MSEITIRCELCTETVAICDTEELRQPIRGSMFHSHMPDNGLADPWIPELTWEDMWCIYGGKHRPFMQPDKLLLNDGSYYDVPKAAVPGGPKAEKITPRGRQSTGSRFHCKHNGCTFASDHSSSRDRHMKTCSKRK